MSDISSPTHADLRSTSRSYKRDKNHTIKWSLGARPESNGAVIGNAWKPDAPSTSLKSVPLKYSGKAPKSNTYASTKDRSIANLGLQSANMRVTRKQDELREITSAGSKSFSRSLADLVPIPSTSIAIPVSKNDAADADILYSFDKKSSPSDKVGLGGLIEKAEQRFREKETVKLVKNEYEVLDGDGEKEVLRKGGKLERVKGGAPINLILDDEDDYELV